MVEKKIGTAVYRRDLSPVLAIFRLVPESGSAFPDYTAGQYIALRREHCRLTKKIARPDGRFEYVPDLDENGNQKRGPVTHSYSISSAPYETREHGYLEFYVILQMHETGVPGRLTESLFQLDPLEDNTIVYYSRIAGEFTLERRAKGFRNVVFVGTGTGLAPFASMIKQLDYEAARGETTKTRYTLIHTNRGVQELGYHHELVGIQNAKRFDFVYVPTISRPAAHDHHHDDVGKGRANNILRSVFGMPSKEEELLADARSRGANVAEMEQALQRLVPAQLPPHVNANQLRERMTPGETVILTCGNPELMIDIAKVGEANGIRVEREEW
jgi:ferredoxin-NADP reductase